MPKKYNSLIYRKKITHSVHRPLQPSLVRTRRQLRDDPAAPPRRHQGTGTVRQEHEGVPEPRRSRSRQALQLCEERGYG